MNTTTPSVFTVTETLSARTVRRNTASKARLIAYDAVIRMVHDNTQLGREIRRVQKWNGGHLIIRYGDNHVLLESR